MTRSWRSWRAEGKADRGEGMSCPRCGHSRYIRTLTAYATIREEVAATPEGETLLARRLLQVLRPIGPARMECMACGEAWWEEEASLAPTPTAGPVGVR